MIVVVVVVDDDVDDVDVDFVDDVFLGGGTLRLWIHTERNLFEKDVAFRKCMQFNRIRTFHKLHVFEELASNPAVLAILKKLRNNLDVFPDEWAKGSLEIWGFRG